ncbi:hypothetical protein PISMIDRAFT_18819 [Pisolithus microcarpus 441]|uniref:Uncharacterized protein n=1 Tax=Pisolithus microcarpus 441 TaxID=765257 RepID=A0A0C9XJ00_9AGAM|nr:hypothetical protein PISMIDRAFT_18819 [Pisolithus microcarpus 441]
MPAIVNLADETACLVRHTPYNELCRQISRLERELEDTSHNLCHALRKVDDLRHAPHPPTPTIPTPTTVEQAAHDLERAHIASLGGGIYDYNQEAGSSRVAPPPAAPPSSSLRGRAQAKPASQVAPGYDFTVAEDEITSAQIYDDIPMVVETTTQGTLFPEFMGHENLYRVLCLGQGKDSVRKILFVRVNDNLYAYSDERFGAALANIQQGTPPPLPIKQGQFPVPVTRWERGIMGPIGLFNTAEDIHKLYAQVYKEPEEKAPCVRRAQELVTYINLWKKCRLDTNGVMELALKEWRPPAWASQKVRQKREALREKDRAWREEEALTQQPTGGQLALQLWLEGHPATPLPEMGQRPIVPLRDHLMVESPGAPQALVTHQRPPTRGQPFQPRGGGCPSGRKTRGGVPNLPQEAPGLDAPVTDWVSFINTYQNRYNGSDESSELSRMFPGALGISERPDNDEWDISPPTAQQVQGFLLYEQLALVPRGNYDQMVWFQELVHLLAVKGRYRALLDWAEVSPHVGPCVPWEGEFTQTASMADIAAYLTANSITPHDADDILIWARRAGNEYITHTVNNGGDQDPNV